MSTHFSAGSDPWTRTRPKFHIVSIACTFIFTYLRFLMEVHSSSDRLNFSPETFRSVMLLTTESCIFFYIPSRAFLWYEVILEYHESPLTLIVSEDHMNL